MTELPRPIQGLAANCLALGGGKPEPPRQLAPSGAAKSLWSFGLLPSKRWSSARRRTSG